MSLSDASKSPWGESKRRRGNKFPIKREAVLTAAAALLRRNGYNGMSLADLADTLNVTKPTLYYYVGSKEELYSEIVTRAQTQVLQAMQDIAARQITGIEKLRAVMFAYAELITSDFGACVIVSRPPDLDHTIRREMDARSREANALIYRFLAEGEEDGTLKDLDSAVVLHTIFGALNWLPQWYKPTGRASLRKIAETQIEIFIDGMRGPAAQTDAAPARIPRVRQRS